MKHDMTQWKCFVSDKHSSYEHKMTLVHLKVPYYRALTLFSNMSIKFEMKLQNEESFI